MSKASNLRKLQQAGMPVPAFVVVPAALFDAFLKLPGDHSTARAILQGTLPASLATQILGLIQPFAGKALAVRSSMAGEDSTRYSFAGQLDSFLNVQGDEAMLAAVKSCWASAYGERAAVYRREHGLSSGPASMEVIIQEMVPAEVSGVVFTADPVARDPRWIIISAAEGLGEALVQGQVAGETYRLNRESGAIESSGQILSAAQIKELARLSRMIEELFGAPQDIEFALAAGRFYILQARPITTPVFTDRILWDNSNITESYSGVTSPLTYSVVREAYARVYRQFLELMGVRRLDEGVLRNLLGFYHGQVYYQLLNWYAALGWLPAFDQNRRFMDQMMGVKQSAATEAPRKAGGQLALARWALRLAALHLTSEQRVRKFRADFDSILAEYQRRDLGALTPHQLRAAYLDLQARVLGNWQAPILTDFFAMIFFGALRALSQRWLGEGGSFHNDLLAGDGAIESLEPARRVQALARQVRDDPALRALMAQDPAEILAVLPSKAEFAAFHQSLQAYLQLYGDRCMNELKLEEPNLRDDPARLIRMIASAVEHPAELGGERHIRIKAEARLAGLPAGKRMTFRWILGNARRHIRNRENMRFARTRLFGLVRGIINGLGRQWAEAGFLQDARDIYYLTIGEIWDLIEGTSVDENLQGLVTLRRDEFLANQARSAPDRFETFGVPYLDEPRDLLRNLGAEGDILHGTGCCSGQVRGLANVITGLEGVDSVNGHILVAERTDPGWVFLFPSAAGILIERGSPLSHSAIVAREMGKPIVVNIPNLTRRVKTGDELDMDGGQGLVRLLKK
jgi:phosphohistidine swiveling domain-containing protein